MLADNVKHLLNKPDLVIHHRFFKRNNRKVLFACNTRNGVFDNATFGRFYNIRTCLFRTESVANSNRNTCASYRKNRFAMQNVRSHIRKFAKFLVGEFGNPFRRVHNTRITSVKTANVRPVFVQRRHHRTRNDCAGNIAAATGKGFHLTVCAQPVKTRNNRAWMLSKKFCAKLEGNRI